LFKHPNREKDLQESKKENHFQEANSDIEIYIYIKKIKKLKKIKKKTTPMILVFAALRWCS
jgi:hypothetical protein